MKSSGECPSRCIWASVHAGHGYDVCLRWRLDTAAHQRVVLLPLIIAGPGRASPDAWPRGRHLSGERRIWG